MSPRPSGGHRQIPAVLAMWMIYLLTWHTFKPLEMITSLIFKTLAKPQEFRTQILLPSCTNRHKTKQSPKGLVSIYKCITRSVEIKLKDGNWKYTILVQYGFDI